MDLSKFVTYDQKETFLLRIAKSSMDFIEKSYRNLRNF